MNQRPDVDKAIVVTIGPDYVGLPLVQVRI
jgi:hypothetical protein